jgi:hypothetical protein
MDNAHDEIRGEVARSLTTSGVGADVARLSCWLGRTVSRGVASPVDGYVAPTGWVRWSFADG